MQFEGGRNTSQNRSFSSGFLVPVQFFGPKNGRRFPRSAAAAIAAADFTDGPGQFCYIFFEMSDSSENKFNVVILISGMEKFIAKDMSEKMEFGRAGYDYKNLVFDEAHHCGIWKMTRVIDGEVCDMGYEVVRGKRYKNPDGSIVYRYPGDEDFGSYGFFSYNPDRCMEILSGWLKD